MPDLSDILENVFLLIPLAVVVFARGFVTVVRNASRAKHAGMPAGTEAHAPAGRPSASSRNMVERFLERMKVRSAKAPAMSEPLEFELEAKRRYERPVTPVRTPAAPPRLVEESRQAPVTGRKRAFPETVERLPPLQKAVALSEILGPPRSLQD